MARRAWPNITGPSDLNEIQKLSIKYERQKVIPTALHLNYTCKHPLKTYGLTVLRI